MTSIEEVMKGEPDANAYYSAAVYYNTAGAPIKYFARFKKIVHEIVLFLLQRDKKVSYQIVYSYKMDTSTHRERFCYSD